MTTTKAHCFACGQSVTPWDCKACAEVDGDKEIKAPPITRACKECHRHGPLNWARSSGCGSPRTIVDDDAGSYRTIACRALEEQS